MSAIVVSSEDEDDCFIVDPEEPRTTVQPPHSVFIYEKETHSLLIENESDENEDPTSNLFDELEKHENISTESISSHLSKTSFDNEIFKGLMDRTTENSLKPQNFYNEQTSEFDVFERTKNDGETPIEHTVKLDSNAIFQRLAEELTKALSSSTDLPPQIIPKTEQCDTNVCSEEIIIPDTCVSSTDSPPQINPKPEQCDIKICSEETLILDTCVSSTELPPQINPKPEQCNTKICSEETPISDICITTDNSTVPIKTNDFKKHSVCISQSYDINGLAAKKTITHKKRGRKPGWKKNQNANPEANKSPVNNNLHTKPLHNEHDTNVCSEEKTSLDACATSNSPTFSQTDDSNRISESCESNGLIARKCLRVKKRGRKPGRRKNQNTNTEANKSPVNYNLHTKPLHNEHDTNVCSEEKTSLDACATSNSPTFSQTDDSNRISQSRESNGLIVRKCLRVKKRGRKPGRRRNQNTNTEVNKSPVSNNLHTKAPHNELDKNVSSEGKTSLDTCIATSNSLTFSQIDHSNPNSQSCESNVLIVRKSLTVKKRGRKPGWKKNQSTNPVANKSPVNYYLHTKQLHNERDTKVCSEEKTSLDAYIATSNSPTFSQNDQFDRITRSCKSIGLMANKCIMIKKRGRKLGWRKNQNTNPEANKSPVNNNLHTKALHSELDKNVSSEEKTSLDTCIATTNSPTFSQNDQFDRITRSCKSIGLLANKCIMIKKRGRKPGWKKNQNTNTGVNKSPVNNNLHTKPLHTEHDTNECYEENTNLNTCIATSDSDTLAGKQRGRKLVWRKNEKINTDANKNPSTNTSETNKVQKESKTNVRFEEIKSFYSSDTASNSSTPRQSIDIIPHSDRALQYCDVNDLSLEKPMVAKEHGRTPSYHGQDNCTRTKKQEDISTPVSPQSKLLKILSSNKTDFNVETSQSDKTSNEISKQTTINNVLSHAHSDIQSMLTGDVDQDANIIKEDFAMCYNKIFDDSTDLLIIKLADVLLLTMKEVINCSERLNATKLITYQKLQDIEISISVSSFKTTLSEYRNSFCPVFQKIIHRILSNREIVYQHKALILAVFLKTFLRVSSLSPEYLDKLILAKKALTILIEEHMGTVPQSTYRALLETFFQTDTEFERNCWLILDFCLASLPEATQRLMDKSREGTTCQSTTRSVDGAMPLQSATTVNNAASVSVIVRNEFLKSPSNIPNPQVEIEETDYKQQKPSNVNLLKNANEKICNDKQISVKKQIECQDESLKSDEGGYYASKNIKSASDFLESQIRTLINNKQVSFTKVNQNHEKMVHQNSQGYGSSNTSLNTLNLFSKANTAADNIAEGKRKAYDSEETSRKIPKTTMNTYPNENPRQNICENIQSNRKITVLEQLLDRRENADCSQRCFQCPISNSDVTSSLQPKYKYYSCTGTNCSVASKSGQNISIQSEGQTPTYYDTHYMHSQLQGVNSVAHNTYRDSSKKSLLNESPHFKHTIPNIQNYARWSSGQQNIQYHQAMRTSPQTYITANAQIPSNGQNPPSNFTPSLNLPTRHQSTNLPYTNPHFQRKNSTHKYHLNSPLQKNLTDSRLFESRSTYNALPNQSVGYINQIRQNIHPSMPPIQVQSMASKSGVTINNYNINTYVPSLTSEQVSQQANLSSQSSYHYNVATSSHRQQY